MSYIFQKQPMDHGDDENGEHQAYFSGNKSQMGLSGALLTLFAYCQGS